MNTNSDKNGKTMAEQEAIDKMFSHEDDEEDDQDREDEDEEDGKDGDWI